MCIMCFNEYHNWVNHKFESNLRFIYTRSIPESIMKSFLSSSGGTLGLNWDTPSAIALKNNNDLDLKGGKSFTSYKTQSARTWRYINVIYAKFTLYAQE